ncbi:RNA polymerase sigma-D factor [bacterium BMS3Abin05]|nr:RNA polymerase sigma-D factor [bacterium BMS3Abin05]GBE28843.1 RNA polymerase sigma-D factor [bacterium BMS3Bbin03]
MAVNFIAKKAQESYRDEIDIQRMWIKYVKLKDHHLKEQLLVHYLPVVKFVVGRMMISLPNSVNFDDLESAGIMGLISAIDRYNPSLGVKFETFVVPRIRGAILDELRALDWVPRSVRSKARQLERAIEEVESRTGKAADPVDIAEQLNMNLDEYESLLGKVANGNALLSLDREFSDGDEKNGTMYDLVKNAKSENPEGLLIDEELKRVLIDEINKLPESERMVISLYYYEELTLKEIGVILNISESRVSQIHTKAINRLKLRLKNHV